MGGFVTTGAMMTCTFGLTPCPLVVLPARTVMLNGRPKANITDFAPIINIASFGMCSAPTNPTVIAATAAAMGVFTPMPCIPAITSPWIPGYPQVLVQGMPALTDDCRNVCMWLGQISFTHNGQIPVPGTPAPPPIGSSFTALSGVRLPLTPSEISSMSGGNGGGGGGGAKEQYDKDVAKASKAGNKDDMTGKAYDKAARDFEKKGETEKAAKASQQAEKARAAAEEKRNAALGDVNQQYRETLPLPEEKLAKLSKSQRQEYDQKRQAALDNKANAYKEAGNDRIAKASQQESQPPKSDSRINAVKDALKEHYAKKAADKAAAEAVAAINRDTLQQTETE